MRVEPVWSATVASTRGFIPRRRTGCVAIVLHLDEQRGGLLALQRRDRACLSAGAWKVLEQVADGVEAERVERSGGSGAEVGAGERRGEAAMGVGGGRALARSRRS